MLNHCVQQNYQKEPKNRKHNPIITTNLARSITFSVTFGFPSLSPSIQVSNLIGAHVKEAASQYAERNKIRKKIKILEKEEKPWTKFIN